MQGVSQTRHLSLGPWSDPREPGEFLLVRHTKLRVYGRQRRLLSRELLVKVGGIRRIADGREVWRWDSFMENVVEIDILKEQVSLDIFSIGLAGSKSTRRVTGQKLVISHLFFMTQSLSDSPFEAEKQHHAAS